MGEPLPEAGWSREIVSLRNAWIFPPAAMTGRPCCGVVTAEGQDCLHASTWRGGIRMTRKVAGVEKPGRFLQGRHVWGGLYYGHFGHFMTETMARCWAFDRDGVESVLFMPKHEKLSEFQKYQSHFWTLLGITAPERILREPLVVEELLVPGQGFGLGRIAEGTPEFHAAMRRLAARVPTDPARRIYISRTKFNGRGGVLAEKAIERNMIAQGYTIMHPEKMELPDQLRFYKSATHILGIDSSAFHIAGMVADPGKRIGFILRRDNNAHESIAAQIRGMTGRDPIVIDALVANWMEKEAAASNHLSWGELDFDILGRQLARNGFIDKNIPWHGPDRQDMSDSLARVQSKHDNSLVRVAVAG